MLATACDNPILGTDGGNPAGNVIIKIAGSNGRTVLPTAPVYSKFELTLQKEGDEPIEVADTSGIGNDAGVAVNLTEGNWTITLNAYQDVLQDGGHVLAAKGSAEVEVAKGERTKTVQITLNPLAIGETGGGLGVFSYTITLPPDAATATLSLKHSNGGAVEGHDDIDLTIGDNLSGRIGLPAGYYDLSVIVTKGGQSAGTFESVHVYSGLESPLTLNLSGVAFADKVYIAGTLGGVRLGTVKIASDPAGNSAIKTLELDGSAAVRSANWIIDIPSSNAGQTLYAVQEFHGEKTSRIINQLPLNGVTDVALSLTPATPELFNVAAWYSELTAAGGTNLEQAANDSMIGYWQSERNENDGSVWLEVDFGFDVTVNASRLIFYSESGSVFVDGYTVEYGDGVGWSTAASRSQRFNGSTDGSIRYSNFFTTVTASKFRWAVSGINGDTPALIEFGLYKAVDQAVDRSALLAAIAAAQDNHDTINEDTDGEHTEIGKQWVTAAEKQTYQNAINAAQAAYDDPLKNNAELSAAKGALDAATAVFIGAKKDGKSGEILVNGFSVQDGYKDKFVVKWEKESNKKYTLSISPDNQNWTIHDTFPIDSNAADEVISYTVTGIPAGTTRYFEMQAFMMSGLSEISGETVSSGACMTLGVPALTLVNNGPSYHTVSLSWTEAQKADTYRIVYSFAGDSTSPHSVDVAANVLTQAGGSFTYSLRPAEHNNPIILGRKMDIKVEALNIALWNEVSGPAFFTSSNTVETRLVGPAALNAGATQAASATNIALSWDTVEGAGGYYVYRRQFNMNDTAETAAAITYYVPAGSGTLTVTGKVAAGNGETTTTKATAAVAGNRYTLTDTWMTDSEYSGTYNSYAANYKNQQNELARGNAYRYFVVPVIASTDAVAFTPSGDVVTYTIGDVTYNNAAALEKTGFTVGFAQNVTATKGTYASSGNTNDGIQISWSAPPLLAGTGVTPQYTVWRKAYDETTWSYDPVSVTNASYNDNPVINPSTTRGVVYEYAVGINGSRPIDSTRFMNDSRAQLDGKGVPNGYGYMLDLVKLQGVSRNEIKVGDEFGEDVTFFNTGVKNGGTDTNWGIDGYTVYVMNRNINGNWHIIADGVSAAASTSAMQVVRVTTGQASFNGRDLLRVMRDYKHYFKVRSYVLNSSGAKVYCPDPDWNYETLFRGRNSNNQNNYSNQDNADFLQTDYVKWGARQVSVTEFARITTLHIAWGIHNRRGGTSNGWQSQTSAGFTTTSNNGSSGRVGSQSSAGVGKWWFYFDNYKPDMDTFANKGSWDYSTTFLTLNADGGSTTSRRMIYGDAYGAGCYPRWYGRDGNYGSDFLIITGPSCVSPLYSGQLRFGNGSGGGHLTWYDDGSKSGYMQVKYPASAAEVNIGDAEANTPLPLAGQPNAWYSGTESRRTNQDAWY
jgi:hypothetical protein